METRTRSIVTRSSANKSVEGNVHNVQKDTVMPRKPIVTHSTANKAASKLLHKAKIKIKGSWEFVNNERAERAKLTKCYLCGAQKDTLRALESHIRRKHKSYRYKCKYCKKKYLTRAGRNKHEMYHTIGYRFRCKDCNKRFLFASQYEEHRSVHTGENRYICRKKGCRKHYGSTRARNYHERQHNTKAMYCDFRETPTSKSAIKSSTADNIYSSIIKVSMAMDGMQNVVRTILGQHNALLMKKNVLLVEKIKSRRKLVNWLRGNELFPHIIENVKFLVLK